MTDDRRIAADGAGAPAPRRSSFASGFFGCFGVLAAIVVFFIAAAVLSGFSSATKSRAIADGTAAPRDYVASCALGLAVAEAGIGRLAGAHLSTVDPVILNRSGGVARVQCVLDMPEGGLGAVTVDVTCGADEQRCVDVVSAIGNGRTLYLSKSAK